MPVFISLSEASEKAEKGRGLFERSEFRSPRRREKRKAGVLDNERAVFLDNFFVVRKMFQNVVIPTTTREKEFPAKQGIFGIYYFLKSKNIMLHDNKVSGFLISIFNKGGGYRRKNAV